ncbi:hypothetical protein EDB80DRAFT_107177 [Ilyonectria destructans]|nr:hypothetical protein EDB80DRAFT_107177 [Ilyonectria destructans]
MHVNAPLYQTTDISQEPVQAQTGVVPQQRRSLHSRVAENILILIEPGSRATATSASREPQHRALTHPHSLAATFRSLDILGPGLGILTESVLVTRGLSQSLSPSGELCVRGNPGTRGPVLWSRSTPPLVYAGKKDNRHSNPSLGSWSQAPSCILQASWTPPRRWAQPQLRLIRLGPGKGRRSTVAVRGRHSRTVCSGGGVAPAVGIPWPCTLTPRSPLNWGLHPSPQLRHRCSLFAGGRVGEGEKGQGTWRPPPGQPCHPPFESSAPAS